MNSANPKPQPDIKRVSLKTEGVKIKSYDINSLLEGHCIFKTGFILGDIALFV